MGLNSTPGMSMVYAFPRVEMDEKTNLIALEEIKRRPNIFRYACAKAHSVNLQKTPLSIPHLIGGERMNDKLKSLYDLLNQAKDASCSEDEPVPKSSWEGIHLDDVFFPSVFQFKKRFDSLEHEVWELNKEIDASKKQGDWPSKKSMLAQRFAVIAADMDDFLPK
jgi:hypothetical protein